MNSLARKFAAIILVICPLQTELLHSEESRAVTDANLDTDHDGLSDELEQALLLQFAPRFMVDPADCARVPAEFIRNLAMPRVQAENGTIYGQVFPSQVSTPGAITTEIHFYHLWSRDCGSHGHSLDTEHVSVLVQASDTDTWTALYWFAAAHENTVCDVSQIARAATLHAEERGATVWVSPGKHASFLNEALGGHGCGDDLFGRTVSLPTRKIVNLGEPGHPMNGSSWIASANWPLTAKMSATDFPNASVARLNELPGAGIPWFNPGKHPAQGVIAISASTADAIGNSGKHTADAISMARDSTGNALQNSYRDTLNSLSSSAAHTRKFLRLLPAKK